MYAGISQSNSISGRPAWKEKEIMYHVDYTGKLLQCCYQNARQPPYHTSGKPLYAASWQWPEAPVRQYEPYT